MADKRDPTAGKKEIQLSEFWMHCLLAIYLLLGNMPNVLMPGSNPAPLICAAQVIVQKSKSAPKFAERDSNRGNKNFNLV